MNIIRFLCKLDSDPSLAATIAIIVMVLIIIGCSTWLIVKKVLLNKKYHADEQFVKEYKKKLKEKESQEQNETVKPGMIEEDF